jgi:dihydropteroate synthase
MDAAQIGRRDAFLAKIGSRPLIMGILNVTPDSFSDGGRYQDHAAALAHARQMIPEGADIIDVGGESTRPGANPVAVAEEIARVTPVLEQLGRDGVTVSIDTYKAEVAARAIALGVVLVNDPWGLQKDADLAAVVAGGEAAVVITHNRVDKDETRDIIDELKRFFDRSLTLAVEAGIPRQRIILDPGIAFMKSSRQNLAVLARLGELADYGLPILIGVSRKRFLGSMLDGVEETSAGTLAAGLAALAQGAAILRVHDVAVHAAAARVFDAIRRESTR